MKTLVVYNKNTGDVVFTQTNALEEYNCLLNDIEESRQPIKVIDGEVILDDTPEVKEAKKKLKELEEEMLEIKMSLLELEDL